MPFVTPRQQRWGNSPAGVEALGGESKVHEWNEATKSEGFIGKKKKHVFPKAKRG
jgi:hypothetical protein